MLWLAHLIHNFHEFLPLIVWLCYLVHCLSPTQPKMSHSGTKLQLIPKTAHTKLMQTVNRIGNNPPPCLTPLETPKGWERIDCHLTCSDCFWCQKRSNQATTGGKLLQEASGREHGDQHGQKLCWEWVPVQLACNCRTYKDPCPALEEAVRYNFLMRRECSCVWSCK